MKKVGRTLFVFCTIGFFLAQFAGTKDTIQPVLARSTQVDCVSGSGWRWVSGPAQPAAAAQAQQALLDAGVHAVVTARGYGEIDSCGSYRPSGTDFSLSLLESRELANIGQDIIQQRIQKALDHLPGVQVGNVQMRLPSGEVQKLPEKPLTGFPEKITSGSSAVLPAATVYNRKVYVVVYDPYVNTGKTQRLHEFMNWNYHANITANTVNLFSAASSGRMQFNVVQTTILDEFPIKADGFQYTIQQYLDMMYYHNQEPHFPDGVDYNKIVNDPRLDICGKANRGEIDEVWIYNGPYFGFWESTLVGPDAYWFNSPPVPGPFTCERTIPIMGPSPERWTGEAVENFGHRTESTMSFVYGGWEENRTSHSWDKFALVKSQSSNYNYSGCGSIHYPPNAARDYEYDNPSTVQTDCEDFHNYPNITYPPNSSVLEAVTCTEWGCENVPYFTWWFSNLPSSTGCGPDRVANDWWLFFSNPALAQSSLKGCTFNPIFLPGVTRQ